ncbi:dihydroxyacetone kinase subunit L [Brasilonema octagenarum UFV-E1]|uniref:Dihydroxyacetone kinase subunit L n=1 Tax=Brasilonema sennae CENA114 TaxID=415709 RepID=A0A856MQZ0_9CYAN|nr:dihydroxyacetone kinase subunit DhaL [Brasilonema sennae]QDL12021.1 dihydroxyacetone kinase subunit L [Brasilonema sennae CENA114]QDL18396.1 dihydroxyacetone kinase subunit L [Brasilonema octagenarum UFV-E1]
MVTKEQILRWLQTFATQIEQNKDYLTELDAAIGDADHGINMDRGFKKAIAQLPTVADKDIGSILKTVSMTLISSIGGASGPLYGTFFLRASTAVAGKQELTAEDVLEMLKAGLDGVLGRGKAQLGDKTMIDVLTPAVIAFQEAVSQGQDTLEAMQRAVAAAEQGVKDTAPMIAKKGRASYLGERSIGHQDPGATSCYWMLKSLLTVLESSGI